jgi:hypothetical protein
MKQENAMELKDLGLSYEDAAHGIQSAIKFEQENERREVRSEIKHLRTGLDCRAADALGLATLMIKKGVFTEQEYLEHMRLAMNAELVRYEEHVRIKFGLPESVSFR